VRTHFDPEQAEINFSGIDLRSRLALASGSANTLNLTKSRRSTASMSRIQKSNIGSELQSTSSPCKYRMEFANRYEPRSSCLFTRLRVTHGDEQVERDGPQHVHTACANLSLCLIPLGLAVIDVFGDSSGKPFVLGNRQLYLLALMA
jgi:hypothetical protein